MAPTASGRSEPPPRTAASACRFPTWRSSTRRCRYTRRSTSATRTHWPKPSCRPVSQGQALGPGPGETWLSVALEELLDRRARLVCRHREREPVAGVGDRLVPGEVAPEVEVLLGIARRLRELAREGLG